MADFYSSRPKTRESASEYWARLNRLIVSANRTLNKQGQGINEELELISMFARNCPCTTLRSLFKTKPLKRWGIDEIQELIETTQREERLTLQSESYHQKSSNETIMECLNKITERLDRLETCPQPRLNVANERIASSANCKICNNNQHSTRDHCWRERLCFNCFQSGHITRNCPHQKN